MVNVLKVKCVYTEAQGNDELLLYLMVFLSLISTDNTKQHSINKKLRSGVLLC